MLSFKDVMHKKCTDISTKQTKIMIFLYPKFVNLYLQLLLKQLPNNRISIYF